MISSNMPLKGIHHITAIASGAAENYRFYTRVLGLRLVKKTVNFDDPNTYHFYYGDTNGIPGTILTFFPWEAMHRGLPGAGEISATAFSIPKHASTYWLRRLNDFQYPVGKTERFGETILHFTDPHGLPLELVETDLLPQVTPWKDGPVPAEFAIGGFHSATATVNRSEQINSLLTEVLGMEKIAEESKRTRYRMADPDAPGILFDILTDRNLPYGRMGGGSVHHIAFRATDDEEQKKWQTAVSDFGLQVTPIIDRNYFRSIYFRTEAGILFEIATDPPGFSVDETIDRLGSDLMLPARYEVRRPEIERQLPPLDATDEFKHTYIPPQNSSKAETTIVPLHGTGGNENDLLTLTWEIFGKGRAVISPRGRILENGMPRYFRRLAEGVFDKADVKKQAHALADFLIDAAAKYGRDPSNLTALGYSNGANIAAAVMLLRPEVISQAVLLRPMLPLMPELKPDLSGKQILIIRGSSDNIIPAEDTDRLIEILQQMGAEVSVKTIATGHQITAEDIKTARSWIASTGTRDKDAAA